MQTFISNTISDILSKHKSLEDVVIVLPSQRAGVFVREACKNQIQIGFLPLIFSIEEFVTDITGFDKIDNIQLLFHFYEVYKKIEVDPQDFDAFSNWAMTALQDFNEVDQYLVNTKDLFNYVRDIKRLQKWSVEDQVAQTDMMKTHYSFVEQLGKFYSELSQSLSEQKKGYQGLIFKEAVEQIDNYLSEHTKTAFYFVGFNALTKSEEILIQKVLQHPNSDIYWDIDASFLNSNHQAGNFIRKYQSDWTFYEKNDLKEISQSFSDSKKIEVIGATKNVTQIKEVGNLLQTFNDFSNTALVLGDESLLPVMLNSIPKNVPSINITMGYTLKDVPAFQMITDYFDLYISREKLQTQNGAFYYKTLLKFLNNASLKNLLSHEEKRRLNELSEIIVKENMSFVPVDVIQNQLKTSNIQLLIHKEINVMSFIDCMINFIEKVRDQVSEIEKEYLFRFYTAFVQLKNLHSKYGYFGNLKTLFTFFKQVIGKEMLSFQGEPLNGLQCMGVLETRVLDFENVIITSVNEGVIPKNNHQSSFIPFDVKVHFGLPTYKEKDAIFSYHIFRLFQRAKSIYLFYNTESDVFGAGEKSSFISQLALLRGDIDFKTVSPKVTNQKRTPIQIEKTTAVIDKLKERAEKGFSPSAIGSYLYNPVEFYKQKVLGLDEKEEVEETLAANTMGSIIHKTLEELYLPFLNRYLTLEDLDSMRKKAISKIDSLFPKYFKKGNFKTGKNKLIYEIVVNYIQRFLKKEQEIISKGSRLKILEVEKQMETQVQLKGIDFPIRLYGEIDRIDELDGKIRIIDYKTGLVMPAQMRIPTDWNLNDYKHSKAIQVMMYALMFMNSNSEINQINAGNISFKKLKDGFLPITFSGSREQKNLIDRDRLLEFQESLGEIFKEIFDINIPFIEK